MARWVALGFVVLGLAGGVIWWLQEPPADDVSEVPHLPGDEGGPEKTEASPALKTTERTEPDTVEAKAKPPLPDEAVRVFGKAILPDKSPARGAQIDVMVLADSIASTTTGDDGSFEMIVTREAMGVAYTAQLRAQTDGHGLLKSFAMRMNEAWPNQKPIDPEIDMGALTLQAGENIDVRAVLPTGGEGPATIWFITAEGRGGGSLFATIECDPGSIASSPALPPGTWRVLATAKGAGRGQVFVKIPQEKREVVEVDMPDERTGVLAVVDGATDAPVEGATVFVREFVQAPTGNFSSGLIPPPDPIATDANGQIVFRGLNKLSSLTIFVEAEGYPSVANRYGLKAAAQGNLRRSDTEVTIKLFKPRTITWPIAADGAPPDGATISLRAETAYDKGKMPEGGGVIEGGRLVVPDWPAGHARGLAVAPDGSMARLHCLAGQTEGKEITFVPARAIDVTLRYDDGKPASGLYVHVANQGNNPIGTPAKTDAQGKARIENLFGGTWSRLEVRVSDSERPWGGMNIATVDLTKGDAAVEGTVRRAIRITLRVRINGKAELPEITEKLPTGGIGVRMSGAFPAKFDVDEDKAEIAFDWRPPTGAKEIWINVTKQGYLPHTEKRPVPDSAEPWFVDVELKTAGSIVVEGKPPKDNRRQRINVHRWDPEKKRWAAQHLQMMAMGGYARFDANGKCVLQPLETGRYRVVDVANFVESEPVEVVAGGEPPRAMLDASKAGHVCGRVQVPDGVDPVTVSIKTKGGPDFGNPFQMRSTSGLSAQVNKDGEFWLRVPGTMPIEIWAEGLGLSPAPEGGRMSVTKPQEGVTLKVVRGAVARVKFARKLWTRMNPGRPRAMNVGYYKGKVEDEPHKMVTGRLDGPATELTFDILPGTWTLWLDASPFRPVVMENVTLAKEGDQDLGTVEVDEGTTVLVEVKLKRGASMPRLWIFANHEGQPMYHRRGDSGNANIIKMIGLGPGTFMLRGGSHMGGGGGATLNEKIEGDGTGEIKRVIDLTK